MQNLRAFQNDKLSILVAVDMVSEGYDVQSVDCIVLARSTDSEVKFLQQIGRGLRRDSKNPNKIITILDLALNLRRRWQRLASYSTTDRKNRQDRMSDDEVLKMIFDFWDVDNFCGANIA